MIQITTPTPNIVQLTTQENKVEIQPPVVNTVNVVTNPIMVKGDNGLSAYELDVQLNGFVGTEQEWFIALRKKYWDGSDW